eukprot:jgi/Botrbrau1/11466/Bobra.27_4s0007.2
MVSGGCLCGSIRYTFRKEDVVGSCSCHCRICQKSSGGPLINWINLPEASLDITDGVHARRTYASGPSAVRNFCSACGSQLTLKYREEPDNIHLAGGTLDDPNCIMPEKHIWTGSQCSWLRLADGRPFHAGREGSFPRGRNLNAVEVATGVPLPTPMTRKARVVHGQYICIDLCVWTGSTLKYVVPTMCVSVTPCSTMDKCP